MYYHNNIEKETLKNNHYRKVLYTDKGKSQLVLMCLNPGEDIPLETHDDVSQFFQIKSGKGIAFIDNQKKLLKDGTTLIISPGSKHYIKNTSKTTKLKLYSIYSPDEHPPNRVDKRQPFINKIDFKKN